MTLPTDVAAPGPAPDAPGRPPRLPHPSLRPAAHRAGVLRLRVLDVLLLPKFLATELGVGPAAIGALNFANGAAAVASLMASGVLVDRYGRRRFLTAGALLMGASSLGFLAVEGMGPLVYTLRVGHGVAFAMAFVAGAALTVDQAPPRATQPGDRALRADDAVDERGGADRRRGDRERAQLATRVRHRGRRRVRVRGLLAVPPRAATDGPRRAGPIGLARRGAPPRAAASRDRDRARRELLRQPLRVRPAPRARGRHRGRARALRRVRVRGRVRAPRARPRAGDSFGRIRVSAAMLVLYGIGAFSLLGLGGVGLVPIGLVFGLAHGLFYPTYNASVVDGAPESERGRIVALFQAWFNVGLAAGSLASAGSPRQRDCRASSWPRGSGSSSRSASSPTARCARGRAPRRSVRRRRVVLHEAPRLLGVLDAVQLAHQPERHVDARGHAR